MEEEREKERQGGRDVQESKNTIDCYIYITYYLYSIS
jgi:hypothetical protein